MALAASAIPAQWHDQGFITSSGSEVFVFDARGGVRSTLVSAKNDIYDLTMDVDNRHVLLVMRSQKRIVRFDPVTLTVTGTLHTGSPLMLPESITIDQNGDYYIADTGLQSIMRLDRKGAMHRVLRHAPFWDRLEGGLETDPDTGGLLVQNTSNNWDHLYQLQRDGSSLTTLGQSFSGRYGMDIHLPSWDIYSPSCCLPFSAPIKILRLGQTRPVDFTLTGRDFDGVYCLKCDRASAKDQRLVVAPTHEKGGIWFVDLTSRVTTSLRTLGTSMFALDFLNGRNVQPVRVAKGRWEIRLSFPGQAGNIYFVVLGVNGIRPSLLLNDGRKINLVIDDLARATLFQEISHIYWNNHGLLSATGEAVTHLDVNSIAGAARGVRLFIQALTFDPSAPLGIRTIADPVPLTIEGL